MIKSKLEAADADSPLPWQPVTKVVPMSQCVLRQLALNSENENSSASPRLDFDYLAMRLISIWFAPI